jgi:hypothetical protein
MTWAKYLNCTIAECVGLKICMRMSFLFPLFDFPALKYIIALSTSASIQNVRGQFNLTYITSSGADSMKPFRQKFTYKKLVGLNLRLWNNTLKSKITQTIYYLLFFSRKFIRKLFASYEIL